MNKIKQHIPSFIDDVEPEIIPFETIDELLAIPFVDRFRTVLAGFDRFSVTEDDKKSSSLLMAEYEQGTLWLVVGTIDLPIDGLPIWLPQYHPDKESNV